MSQYGNMEVSNAMQIALVPGCRSLCGIQVEAELENVIGIVHIQSFCIECFGDLEQLLDLLVVMPL